MVNGRNRLQMGHGCGVWHVDLYWRIGYILCMMDSA